MISIALVVVCVVLRLVPHPPNFAPVGATAVFAGRTLPRWTAIAITLGAMAVADIGLAALHGYPVFTLATPFVYAGFVAQVVLGRALRRSRGGAVAAAALGAVVFFAVSNFGVWLGGMYGVTAAGLAACYIAAQPFFGASLAGDVLWTIVLSLAHRGLTRVAMARRAAAVAPLTALTVPDERSAR
jgi:hypothetical protein